jgi:hypothetical protein
MVVTGLLTEMRHKQHRLWQSAAGRCVDFEVLRPRKGSVDDETKSMEPDRVAGCSLSSSPGGSANTSQHRGDGGELLSLVDVTGEASSRDVDALIAFHRSMFPEHEFVADEIRTDAGLSGERDGLVVHQWLVRLGQQDIAYMLADCNLARRVVLVHFVGVNAGGRSVRLGGERLSTWLVHEARRQLDRDLISSGATGADALGYGVIGETLSSKLRLWSRIGFRLLPVDYAEPVDGRHWRRRAGLDPELSAPERPTDDELRPLGLLWLPSAQVPPDHVDAMQAEVMPCALAAFLIDHYNFDPQHRLLAPAGAEAFRCGARGR